MFHSFFQSDALPQAHARAFAGMRQTKEQQTNLITDAISPHCLSPFLLAGRHVLVKREDAPHRRRRHLVVPKCTFRIRAERGTISVSKDR